MEMTKQDKREQKREQKKIRMQILNLQERHCDSCTKVEGKKQGDALAYCHSLCDTGMKLKELGHQLDGESPVYELTLENYLLLLNTKPKMKAKQIAEQMGVSFQALNAKRAEWGLQKTLGRKKPAADPPPPSDGVDDVLFQEYLGDQEDLTKPVQDVPIMVTHTIYAALEKRFQEKEKQYAELFKEMQEQDQIIFIADGLIKEFQGVAREALEAIEHSKRKDDVIHTLQMRVIKLEAVLADYLPKGAAHAAQ
jgi:hypothetical protein